MLNYILQFFIKDTYCYQVVQEGISVSFLLYAHLPTALITLFVGIFFLLKGNNKLESKIFFFLTLTFFVFALGDLVEWFSFLGRWNVIFARSIIEILDPVIFILSSYFLYVLLKKQDAKAVYKVIWLLPLSPLFIWSFLGFNLTGFNWTICEAVESKLSTDYIFYIDLFYLVSMIIFAIKEIILNKESRIQNLITSSGIIIFAGLFFVMEYVFTGYIFGGAFDYNYFVYAFFGMPVLIAVLGFLVVKYKMFNIRLVGAQALVFGLVALIASKLFTAETGAGRTITIVTLGFVSVFGYFLVKSVKKEIETRERIEALADQLEHANERLQILDQQKSQFVSIASHQLRAPLTAIKGYLSMIMEGDYGKVEGELREIIQRVIDSSNNLVTIVGDFLDVSRIEQGKMVYDWKDFDLKSLVETVGNEMKPVADKRGLEFVVSVEEGQNFMVHGDMNKLKQVFTNLVDNSIKYTPKGKTQVKLSRPTPGIVRFEVEDNGIGIAAETLPKLFEKFTRAEGANDVNVIGTGLGLYVAKEMVLAHEGGKIWAESDGKGKGSTFVVELKGI